MPDLDPPELNKHGREIWFRYAVDAPDAGAAEAVHPKGRLVFAVSAVAMVIGITIAMNLIDDWSEPGTFCLFAALGLAGPIWGAIVAFRHS